MKSPCPAGLMGGSIEEKFLFSNGRRRRFFTNLRSGVTQQKRAGISRNRRGERLVQPKDMGRFLCHRHLCSRGRSLGTGKF